MSKSSSSGTAEAPHTKLPRPGTNTWLRWICAALAFVGAAGAAVWWQVARTERDLRAELLLQARLVSSSIDSGLMESMPFEKGDRALPDFQRMNRQLRQLAAVLQSGMAPAVEFVGIYSMRLRKGDIVFGPESIPENDHRASQPGSSYEKPPPGLRELFASGQPLIVGPYTDEYGTFVSTFVPLNDSGGRRTETIIGLDVMANEWQRATLAAAAVSVGLTLLAMALLLLSVFSFRANRRVRGQQAILRESEERLRAITDSAQDAIIMQDSKGAITFWNPAAASIFGYVSEEALGRDLHNLLAPEGFPEVYRAAFQDFRRSNAADRTVELAVRRKDGQEILVCLSLSALLIGGEWHAVGILRDITERKRAEEELTRATALLQAAIEQTPAGMLIADAPDVTIRLANPAALGIRGGSAEPLTGIPVELHPGRWLTFWPDGAPVAPEDLPLSRAILKGETVRNEEVVIHRSDGEPRHVLANAAPVRNSQGEVVAGVVVFHDVTEFKQAEAALRLDDERLEVLLALNNMTGASERELTHFAMEAAVRLTNSTIGYVAFLNEDETVLTMQAWSEHAMREGEIAEALVTFPLASSTGPWSEVVRQRRAVITNDTVAASPATQAFPAAHKRLIRHMDAPTLDDDRIAIVAGVGNKPTNYGDDDVRQLSLLMSGLWTIVVRKRAEEAARLTLARRQREAEVIAAVAASANLPEGAVRELAVELTETAARALEVDRVGVWLFEEDETRLVNVDLFLASIGEHSSGTVLLASEFQSEFAALKSAKYVDAHDPLTDPRTAGYVEGYVKPNKITSMLDAVIRAGGRNLGVVCFEHVGRPHHWENDEIAFACQLADQVALAITHRERRQAEAEKEKLREQLIQAQKIESVGRLAGGVAHDFNNMLGVILGHTELASEQIGPDAPLYPHLNEIRKAAERSVDLTRQLLAFARKQTVTPKVIDLNEAVEGMLKMLRRLIGENIDLVFLPGAELGAVLIDRSQVDQILANLCVNARDAIAGTGKITIETANTVIDEDYCAQHAGFVPGDYVVLAVSDDGCGMDAETLSHVFEPFFTTKEMGKGTGLGLATVYGVVKQNDGFINVYSEPGRGTTFKIYLPRHAAKATREKEVNEPQALVRGGETILLVEDEPAILKMTTRMLESLGYTVVTASTPGKAIRLAGEHPGRINLLMTDVIMPEMNGRDLAKELLNHYPKLRRLFMSGYPADVIAHHGVLDPGVHFIQKPFSQADLAAKLQETLADPI